MSRFQALTNALLDAELELLQERLGLEARQKAELLREVVALASWVVRQAEQGRVIEARRGAEVEPLVHPALERLRAPVHAQERIALSDAEALRLAAILDRGFRPPPALRKALANLANPKRRPPKLHWKKSAA